MREYADEAVVLGKENNGDMDSKIFLFTKKFGRFAVKAKSGRKILSKLSAHLEPGNLVQIRAVEKNGFQVVDALKTRKLDLPLAEIFFLNKLLNEAEPDTYVWSLLVSGVWNLREALKVLGWDPAGAECFSCGALNPVSFYAPSQSFLCGKCASKIRSDDLIYI